MTFDHFNFEPELVEGLAAMQFENPTPVQAQSIPIILENKDLIACAQTGTGKTAAYLLPILNKLAKNPTDSIHTLILTPTRELAMQVDQQLQGFSYFVGASSLAVYGGGDSGVWDTQRRAFETGVNIVIGTPGRLLSHMNFGYLKFDKIEHLILDEADKMLDMGFYDDIMKIINKMPKERETLMFSATMPDKIRKLAKAILRDPEEIAFEISKPAEGVLQMAYLTYDEHKIEMIHRLLDGKELQSVLIFSSTKLNTKRIAEKLKKLKHSVGSIHSDFEQREREDILLQFRNRRIQILVATDILSRGIDIEDLDLVINFDVPQDAEDYVHRVGRTARAKSTGVAVTFINEKDQYNFSKIETLIDSTIIKIPIPADLGKSPSYNPNKKRQSFNKRNFKKKKKR